MSAPVLSRLFTARAKVPARRTVPRPSEGQPPRVRPPRGGAVRGQPPSVKPRTPVPNPQSQSFSRGYGSALPTSLIYIALSTRGCDAIEPPATGDCFHLLYDGTVGVTSDEPQLLEVNLVRSNGSPALTGHCLVDTLPQPGILSMQEHFVASGRQVLPLTGVADLEPGDLVGVAHAPLLSV